MNKWILLLMAVLVLVNSQAQSDSAIVLPSHLPTAFQVQTVDNVVLLKWSVAQSEWFKSFDVERADNDSNFIKVGSKLAISKSSASDYDFVDATPKRNTKLLYRLKLIANDGSATFTTPKEVLVGDPLITVRLRQNPVRSNIELEVKALLARQASIAVVSQTGQQVASQNYRLAAGLNQVSLSAQGLQQGLHQLIVDIGTERKIISFIKE